MAWRSNKKGLAIVGLFLFLMGVAVPAAFGLLTEKAMGLGVGDLLDKTSNYPDPSNISSSYFISIIPVWYDGNNSYEMTTAFDDSLQMHLSAADTANLISSSALEPGLDIQLSLNKTAVEKNVDKIVVVLKLVDPAQFDVNASKGYVTLNTGDWSTQIAKKDFNVTEIANNTLKVEIDLDAIKRLKISSYNGDFLIMQIRICTPKAPTSAVLGYRVELYDVKKVNATAASNIMLAVSGVLGWLGALAATPYWNPYANREHRNIRGAYKKVRGKIRVPRRRR